MNAKNIVNMDEDQITIKIKEMLSKHTGVSADDIFPGTMLGEDLCLIGDDAEEFFEECEKFFGIDLSDFVIGDYFPFESTAEMHDYMSVIAKRKFFIIGLLSHIDKPIWDLLAKKKNYIPLTVNEVVDSIKSGSWRVRRTSAS